MREIDTARKEEARFRIADEVYKRIDRKISREKIEGGWRLVGEGGASAQGS